MGLPTTAGSSAERRESEMGRASREKGKRGERMAAKLCRALWPSAVRAISQARGGHETADLSGTPMHVEVKIGKRLDLLGAVRQARRDSGGSRPFLVIGKPDREPPVVVVSWETFATLYAAANGMRDGALDDVLSEETGDAA
jgi:hypothetical protein